MFPDAKILRLNALHRLQEPQRNWFYNNLMTTKLAIKFVVFCCHLTLVAKYAFSQTPSHLEIWLQALGGILQPLPPIQYYVIYGQPLKLYLNRWDHSILVRKKMNEYHFLTQKM